MSLAHLHQQQGGKQPAAAPVRKQGPLEKMYVEQRKAAHKKLGKTKAGLAKGTSSKMQAVHRDSAVALCTKEGGADDINEAASFTVFALSIYLFAINAHVEGNKA